MVDRIPPGLTAVECAGRQLARIHEALDELAKALDATPAIAATTTVRARLYDGTEVELERRTDGPF